MKYSHKTLKNGLQIVTVPMPSNQTATVMVLVETGSDFETKGNNGISHFLEHMCFKGTEKRTLHEITEELDSLGAASNAFTWKEYTGYHAKAHWKHLETMLDVVSDVYLNSSFPEDEIRKERGVIIEEINMYEDMPQRKVWDVLATLMYGDQGAGWTTLGPKKNIRSISREDFIEYRKKHYVAEGTTVVVAGKVDPKKVEALVGRMFVGIPTSRKEKKKKVKESQKSPGFAAASKKTDQAHFILGFRGYDLFDDRRISAEVLRTVLGTGLSSRLFKKLRDELGLCYYIKADQLNFTDHGMFVVYAGVAKKRLAEAVEAIVAELNLITHELVPDRELKKAKEFRIGNTALGLEASDDIASWFGFQALHKEKVTTPEEAYKKLRAVTAEDVQKVAQDLFVEKKANLAVVSDSKAVDKKSLIKLMKF